MGQISVKTYAPNGSLLNDNQQHGFLMPPALRQSILPWLAFP